MENFTSNEKHKKTLSCFHTFHIKCIERWLKIRPSCPFCNSSQRTIEEDQMLEKLLTIIDNRRRITRQYAQELMRETGIVITGH